MSDRERGSVIPIVALSMVALLTVLAIVIDLGFTRSIRRDTRSAADSGATAGAVALSNAANAFAACQDAFAYTYKSLNQGDPTSSAIASACNSFTGTCAASTARTASLTVNSITVNVTNPVPDSNALMNATSLGDISQTLNTATDGAACDRVAVQIVRPQGSFFRGVFGGGGTQFTVHSVALKISKPGGGQTDPALVALNQSTCKAIDAGNGVIYLIGNSIGPGIAYSDSDGPSCSTSNPIISGGSSGQVCAQSSSTSAGIIGWYNAPSSRAYNTSDSVYTASNAVCGSVNGYRYVGQLVSRSERTTRSPIDKIYRCSTVNDAGGQPVCTAANDPLAKLEAETGGSGFATYAGDCNNTSGVTFTVNTYVNCSTFTVKGGVVSISGGVTVVFSGALSVEAGGDLRANTDTTTDGNGYPVATDSTKQSTIIIDSTAAGAFNMQSTSANIRLAQTTVYSHGGMAISGSPVIRWTPPTAGDTQNLIYWSESSQQFSLSGGPSIFAKGIFFQGNGKLFISGGGLVDLQKVQMWVDTIGISGGGGVKLSADPQSSVHTGSPGSSLIR